MQTRLQELKQLQPGWFNGVGKAMDPDGMDWLASWFETHYPEDLPAPRFFPTSEGKVRVEWSFSRLEMSLEIDLKQRTGRWHIIDLANDADIQDTLDMRNKVFWEALAAQIRRLQIWRPSKCNRQEGPLDGVHGHGTQEQQ
jgi:hypothetical protein